jgi:hypothetical protein
MLFKDDIEFDFERSLPPLIDYGVATKNVVCRYWLKDRCLTGIACKFLHLVRYLMCRCSKLR